MHTSYDHMIVTYADKYYYRTKHRKDSCCRSGFPLIDNETV